MAHPNEYVTYAEFDDFRAEIVKRDAKLAESLNRIESAITRDNRTRQNRELDLIQKLTDLTSKVQSLKSDVSSIPPKVEDITGRFAIAEQRIIKKATRHGGTKASVLSAVGSGIAIAIFEIVKSYFMAKGH